MQNLVLQCIVQQKLIFSLQESQFFSHNGMTYQVLKQQFYVKEFYVKITHILCYEIYQGMEDTVWRVGCYNINPTTPNGQKFFILHMLVLPLIPITALVIQNSVTMNTLLGYQSRVSTIRRQVRGAMEIALFIQNLQVNSIISLFHPLKFGMQCQFFMPLVKYSKCPIISSKCGFTLGRESRGCIVHFYQAIRCKLQFDGNEDQ